jgi:hypothetical protein
MINCLSTPVLLRSKSTSNILQSTQQIPFPPHIHCHIKHYHHIKVVFLIAGDQLPLAEGQVDYILQVSVEVGCLGLHLRFSKNSCLSL